MNEYLEKLRAAKSFGQNVSVEAVKPKQTPIKKQTKKKQKERRENKKKVIAEILRDGTCHIKSPVCTGKMQGFDHKQKRGALNVLDDANLIPACNACNQFKESNPEWAEANGKSKSKFKV